MNCIVLLFPGSAMEQGTLLKILGERGACSQVEQSQSANFLQILEKFINSSSNPNQKEAEKSLSADSTPVADQLTESHREGSTECASNGSEDLAGEAHQGNGVEHHGSAVFQENTTCEGSSSGAAEGADVQHIGSNYSIPSQ
jgi:hypothetical protein